MNFHNLTNKKLLTMGLLTIIQKLSISTYLQIVSIRAKHLKNKSVFTIVSPTKWAKQ